MLKWTKLVLSGERALGSVDISSSFPRKRESSVRNRKQSFPFLHITTYGFRFKAGMTGGGLKMSTLPKHCSTVFGKSLELHQKPALDRADIHPKFLWIKTRRWIIRWRLMGPSNRNLPCAFLQHISCVPSQRRALRCLDEYENAVRAPTWRTTQPNLPCESMVDEPSKYPLYLSNGAGIKPAPN